MYSTSKRNPAHVKNGFLCVASRFKLECKKAVIRPPLQMRYTTDTKEYSTPRVRVGDASGGTSYAASTSTALDKMNKRSGALRSEEGKKSQKHVSDGIMPQEGQPLPARDRKSQDEYPLKHINHGGPQSSDVTVRNHKDSGVTQSGRLLRRGRQVAVGI